MWYKVIQFIVTGVVVVVDNRVSNAGGGVGLTV